MSALIINRNYNFGLYTNPVLGTSYQNTKLLAILDYNTALKYFNADLYHKQIFPYLPPGTSPKLVEYTYYLFKHNGKDLVIADAWILPGSVVTTTGINYTIRLNDITSAQFAAVRDQLRLLGIHFDIL